MKSAGLKPIIVQGADGAGLIVLTKPAKCGCGRLAMFVVNRGGKTRCVECDDKVKQDPPAR